MEGEGDQGVEGECPKDRTGSRTDAEAEKRRAEAAEEEKKRMAEFAGKAKGFGSRFNERLKEAEKGIRELQGEKERMEQTIRDPGESRMGMEKLKQEVMTLQQKSKGVESALYRSQDELGAERTKRMELEAALKLSEDVEMGGTGSPSQRTMVGIRKRGRMRKRRCRLRRRESRRLHLRFPM